MSNFTKKSANISENFFASNIFTYKSYSCVSQIERTFTEPGEEATETLKIYADKSHPITFAFESKVGLVRLNEDGSIAESNVLGKLLAIKNDNLSNYFDFFKRNGFLLPVSTDAFDTVGEAELLATINRLHATLQLMSTITDMSRTSYEKIIRMIIYLLFAPIVEIETKDGKSTYRTTTHRYTMFLEKARELSKDSRLNDTFNNSEFAFNDSIVRDTVLSADFISTVLEGYASEEKYNNDLFRKIFTVYCAPRGNINKSILYINDFLFHYYYEVGVIESVDLENTYYLNGEICKDNFSDTLKQAAVRVAKILIKEEIDSNLKRIRAVYDIDKLTPAWQIDSLLSALYFGLFYMRPTMEIYRRCENPKCGEYFLVSVTSRKRKYCCRACMNRDIQARHRAKEKMLASKNQ